MYIRRIIKRLRQMERGELIHLVRRRLWVRWIRRKILFGKKGIGGQVGRRSRRLVRATKQHPFYFFPGDKEAIRTALENIGGGIETEILKPADDYCRKEFHLLGEKFSFKDKVNWHYDSKSGKEWPKVFFSDIVYTGPKKLGDIKLPWELNRHQYLLTLGQAYYFTGNPKYAREIVQTIRSWIEENPPYIGINWNSSLEIAIRLISWMWGVQFVFDSDELTDDFMLALMKSIEIQTEYIYYNLTLGQYANNHLVGEAAALAVVGMCFGHFKKAGRWVKKGLSILEDEVLRQIHPDGGGVEQAFSYLRFTLEFFLSAFLLAEKNDMKVSGRALERIERAFEFLMATMTPEGKSPNFGDCDDARALFFSRGAYWNIRGILALGAALFRRKDFKWVSDGPSEELVWLMGAEGLDVYNNLESEEPKERSFLLEESGYGVMRENWGPEAAYFIFDCGPLGYRSGGHGHADGLSIQLSAYGKPILIDPGTFAYNQNQNLRNYFRSTRAHNTVSVDGMDQAEINGRMSWANIPKSMVTEKHFTDMFDMLSAENDGYTRLLSPVIHKRTVVFCKAFVYYLLIDEMVTFDDHEYALHYHFLPGTRLTKGEQITAEIGSSLSLNLDVIGPEETVCEIKEGDPLPMGWYSEGYGLITESPSITYSCQGNGTTSFYSFILPYADEEPKDIHLSRLEGDGMTRLIVENEKQTDVWILSDGTKTSIHGNIEFSGRLAYLQLDPLASIKAGYVLKTSRLAMDGETYIESEKPYDGYV